MLKWELMGWSCAVPASNLLYPDRERRNDEGTF